MECCPRWFKAREIPPEAEVSVRRCLYQPVPMEDVEIAEIDLPHLLKPGAHTDNFWIPRFPKKKSEIHWSGYQDMMGMLLDGASI